MVDGWGRERSRRGKESTSQRRERDGSRICKRQQLRQEYSTRRREQSEMVSSGKHRREKGKWKIEIRKAKFKSGDRARKNRFNTGTRREEHRVHREEKASDEEVEDEKKETEEEKDGGAVDAAARKARNGPHERNRDGFVARVLANGVERSGRRVAGKVAAGKRKVVVGPPGRIPTAWPR